MKVEICIDSLASARVCLEAKEHVDRVELCAALDVGGVTPSAALVRAVVALLQPAGVAVHVLVRHRGGDFCAESAAEVDMLVDEVRMAAEAGASAVVGGLLAAGGAIDTAATARLVRVAHDHGLSFTFHRAVDCLVDPVAAVETLVELGVDAVLTSGGAATAEAGVETLRRIVEQARGRLQVIAGSGVSASNAQRIVAATGVDVLHGTARGPPCAVPWRGDALGFGQRPRTASAHEIKAIKAAVCTT